MCSTYGEWRDGRMSNMSPRSRATIKSASTMRTHRLRDIPAAMDSEAAVACFFLGGPVGGSDSLAAGVFHNRPL